jgi:hypothetical protein
MQDQEAIVIFFRKYNKVIFITAAILLLALIGTQWYLNAITRDRQLASETYDSMHNVYENWFKVVQKGVKDSKNEDEKLNKLYEKFVFLQQAIKENGFDSYRAIGEIYEVLGLINKGEVALLADLKFSFPSSNESVELADQFLSELKGFVVAKALSDVPEYRDRGVVLLTDLANKGMAVSVAALSVLVELAETEDARKNLLALIPAIVQRQPWQQVEIEKLKERLVR